LIEKNAVPLGKLNEDATRKQRMGHVIVKNGSVTGDSFKMLYFNDGFYVDLIFNYI